MLVLNIGIDRGNFIMDYQLVSSSTMLMAKGFRRPAFTWKATAWAETTNKLSDSGCTGQSLLDILDSSILVFLISNLLTI